MSTDVIIKVSASARVAAVAGAIAGVIRERHRAEVRVIGAGAVNQALKSVILAIQYLRQDGIAIAFVPEFIEVYIGNVQRTAIQLNIFERKDPPTQQEVTST